MTAAENEPDGFVSADAYVQVARLRIAGRSLQRWCDDNPFLAERLREMKLPRRRLYDARTARDFRKHWLAAEVELRRSVMNPDNPRDPNA